MTRYTPPSGKSLHRNDPASDEPANAKLWRYLHVGASALIALVAISSLAVISPGQDFAWWAYGLFGLGCITDLIFWNQWRLCLQHVDDAPSDLSRFGAVIVLFCAVYGFVAAIALLM